jgi:hypothetical protein
MTKRRMKGSWRISFYNKEPGTSPDDGSKALEKNFNRLIESKN